MYVLTWVYGAICYTLGMVMGIGLRKKVEVADGEE